MDIDLSSEEPRVFTAFGVDQGLASVGYGMIRTTYGKDGVKREILSSGTIKTKSGYKKTERLLLIHEKLMEQIKEYKPDAMGCEKLFFNPPQKKDNRNKSASIVITSQATGVVMLTSGMSGLPLYSFVPGTVKKQVATRGNASKEEVQEALKTFCEQNDVVIKSEHEGDGIGIALTMSLLHEKGLLEDSNQE